MRLLVGQIAPLTETESVKRSSGIIQDDLGMPFEEQCESAPGRADIDRLPQPVEHQHVLVKERIHNHLLGRRLHEGNHSVNVRAARRKKWCAREDLNLHPLRDQILSLACLPFHHSRNHRLALANLKHANESCFVPQD